MELYRYFLFLFLFLFLFSLSACNSNPSAPTAFQCHLNNLTAPVTKTKWYSHAQLIQPQNKKVCAWVQFQGYDKIILEGDFDVKTVKTKYRDEPIRMQGDIAFVSRIQAKVVDNTLILRLDPNYNYTIKDPIFITLPFQNIRSFSYKGIGNVVIDELNTPHLDLNLEGNVDMWIKGNIVLGKINFNNDGKLVIHWVNTTNLCINAKKKGSILLAGIANNLTANINDYAILDASYLKTKTAHIHTSNQAEAKINVTKRLNAFAEDNSTIYYDTLPDFIAKYSHGSGSILKM